MKKIKISTLVATTLSLCTIGGINCKFVDSMYVQTEKGSDTIPSANLKSDKHDPNDEDIDVPITQDDYDDFYIFIRNAIAARMNSITSISNKHQAWIKKIVGTFMANVESYDPVLASVGQDIYSGHNWTPQAILEAKYNYLENQALTLGVSTLDYHRFKNQLLQNAINSLSDTVLTADQRKTLYDTFSKALDIAHKKYFDVYGLQLEEINQLLATGWQPSDSSDPRANKVLQVAEQEYYDFLAKYISVSNDASEFTKLVTGYSAAGHYKIGDEIAPEDFGKFLTYTYQYTSFGIDFSKYVPSDIDTWKVGTPGEYDQTIMSNLSVTKAFDGLSSEDSPVTYLPGEILPGITLHIKINRLDTSSDSHICKISPIYGLSQTNHDDILWLDGSDTNDIPDYDPNLRNALDLSLRIRDPDQLNYIASNQYYNHLTYDMDVWKDNTPTGEGQTDNKQFTYRDNYVPQGTTNDPITIFGLDDWTQRPFLDEILGIYNAGGERYNFTDHPLYITIGSGRFGNQDPLIASSLIGDYFGIPRPSNPDDFRRTLGSNTPFLQIYHEHQQLALKISDVNTNPGYNYLTINWCFVDAMNDDEQTTDNNMIKYDQDYKDVYNLPWKVMGQQMDTINLFYHINPTTQAMINDGIVMGTTVKWMSDTLNTWVRTFSLLKYDSIYKYFMVNDQLDTATSALSLAAAALSAINAASYMFGGFNCLLAIKLAFAAIVAVLCSLTAWYQYAQIHGGVHPFGTDKLEGDIPMFDRVYKLNQLFTEDDVSIWNDISRKVTTDLEILNDPKASYSAKKEATISIEKKFNEHFRDHPLVRQTMMQEYAIEYDYCVANPSSIAEGTPISKAEYLQNVEDLVFNWAPTFTDNMIMDTDTAIHAVDRLSIISGQAKFVDSVLTDFTDSVANRITYYEDNNTMPALKKHRPTWQWRQLTEWHTAKRICSNGKNICYLLRDLVNNFMEYNAGAWDTTRSVADFFTGLFSKLFPESNVKFICTFIFGKGQDCIFKGMKAWACMQQGIAKMCDAESTMTLWAKLDPFVQCIRFFVAVCSTALYYFQAYEDDALYPYDN